MTLTPVSMRVVDAFAPLHHPSTTPEGKFYLCYVVEVTAQSSTGVGPVTQQTSYFPITNYGRGEANHGQSGQNTLLSVRSSMGVAISDLRAQYAKKVKAGYRQSTVGQAPRVGALNVDKVRNLIVAHFAAAPVMSSPTPPKKGQTVKVTLGQPKPAFSAAPDKPQSEPVPLDAFEHAASLVLLVTDVEVAISRRNQLRETIDAIRADAERAEDAFALVEGHVRKLLRTE